jgi:hypothetical protein
VSWGVRLGLSGLFGFLAFGMVLEFLLFLDVPFYSQDAFLRRLWSLAHAHGALAWLIYLVYWQLLDRFETPESIRRVGRACAGLGATLLPLGFLLGALEHGADRPSWPIVLAPVGGTLLGAALLLPILTSRHVGKNGNQDD